MHQLHLPLKDSPYTIYIGSALLDNSELLSSYCAGDNVLIVSNEIVAPLYLEKVRASIKDKKVHQLVICDGEVYKSRESFFQLIDYLVENGFRRNDTLLALGGGVIGDLSGFVAASYQRGMNFVQIPTSLLAQVDSSVGGKTAINHQQGKNLIGAFYQPSAVIIDVNTLLTLPEREYLSGFGEIVKYALLGQKGIDQILKLKTNNLLSRDQDTLKELIYLCCQKKASIVEKDEKEKGERALLNLGHTFAHALETLTNYGYYLHGEAVSIGILMALNLSVKKGFVDRKFFEQYNDLFTQLKLPTKILPELNLSEFISVMKKDKKNQTDAFRLVLVREGHCVLYDENDRQLLEDVIKEAMS